VQWVDPADTVPWGSHEQERSACSALRDPKFSAKLKDDLKWAIQDARGSFALKQGRNNQETERIKRTRAAAAAAGVDMKQRCGTCRTCMSYFGVSAQLQQWML